MMPLKFYRYFFLVALLGLTGVLTTANAQNNDCDSCKIIIEIRGQYFKELYTNYYKTYFNSIAEKDKNRIIVAQSFLIYLYELETNNVENYVENFYKNKLQQVKASETERDRFKEIIKSPFEKIKSFINDCESGKIDYTEDHYKESLLNLYRTIDKAAKERIAGCNENIDKEPPNKNGQNFKEQKDKQNSKSFFKHPFIILIYSLLFGVLIFILFRRLLDINLFVKKDRQRLSSHLEALIFTFFRKKKNKRQGSKNLQRKNIEKKKNSSDNAGIYLDKENINDETIATPGNNNPPVLEETIKDESFEDKSNEEEGKNNQLIWEGDEVKVNPHPYDKPIDASKDRLSNESSSNRLEPINNSYEIETMFFPDPSLERTFLIIDGETEASFRSLYKITQQLNKNTGKLEFLSSTDYQFVFNNLERFIYPVCEQKNVYIHNTSMNIKQISPGIVELQDNKWHVTKKVLIEFH